MQNTQRTAFDDMPIAARRRRVLLFAKAKRHTRVSAHIARGFRRNGHLVRWIRPGRLRRLLGRRLSLSYMRRQLRRFCPDLVLVYGKDAPLEVLDAVPAGTRSALFYHDAPSQPTAQVLEVARRCSMVFTPFRGYVGALEGVGLPAVRCARDGCDREDHYPVNPDPAYAGQVAFIGSVAAEDGDRLELMCAVAERFPLKLYGRGWDECSGRRPERPHVYPKHYRKICASAGIMLGHDRWRGIELGFSNRTWLTLGCGGFLLTTYVPGLEDIFTNHQHLVWFRSAEECLDLISHYLPRERERRRIAADGCQYARTYYTYRHTAHDIIEHAFT